MLGSLMLVKSVRYTLAAHSVRAVQLVEANRAVARHALRQITYRFYFGTRISVIHIFLPFARGRFSSCGTVGTTIGALQPVRTSSCSKHPSRPKSVGPYQPALCGLCETSLSSLVWVSLSPRTRRRSGVFSVMRQLRDSIPRFAGQRLRHKQIKV